MSEAVDDIVGPFVAKGEHRSSLELYGGMWAKPFNDVSGD
jgi:hypothetical protein